MIRLLGKVPRDIVLACSGGVDSMAALDFLSRNHRVTVAYFNHQTEHGRKSSKWLKEQCEKHYPNVVYKEKSITGECPKGLSKEEWWRNERYAWLHSAEFDGLTVVTAHHLDDEVETWIWSSMHGTPKLIPYERNNVIRPFLLTRKHELEKWAKINDVEYLEDDSNADICYTRNYIRHELMPHALRVNPGIHKTIFKKVKENA